MVIARDIQCHQTPPLHPKLGNQDTGHSQMELLDFESAPNHEL